MRRARLTDEARSALASENTEEPTPTERAVECGGVRAAGLAVSPTDQVVGEIAAPAALVLQCVAGNIRLPDDDLGVSSSVESVVTIVGLSEP